MKTQKEQRNENAKYHEQACLKCGMPKSEWKANDGQGYVREGEGYCCRGCAEDKGCSCYREENSFK